MFREIHALIAHHQVEFEDVIQANSHLLKYQFAFQSGSSIDKKVFALVTGHFTTFENIFALFGFSLIANNEYGYVGFVPNKSNNFRIPIEQTRLLLVLRVIYHRERIAGNATGGLVLISGLQFVEAYKGFTGRDDIVLSFSTFESFLKPLKDKRIIQISSDKDTESNLPNLTIMPCIQDVATEEFAYGVIECQHRSKFDPFYLKNTD